MAATEGKGIMTHHELLASLERMMNHDAIFMKDALRAVVELHKPELHQNNNVEGCVQCSSFSYRYVEYPCPTIQAIEKELASWAL
jgi:hypothetical protein